MDEAIRQMMIQMQMRRMMESMPGGNRSVAPTRIELDPGLDDYYQERLQAYNNWRQQATPQEDLDAGAFVMRPGQARAPLSEVPPGYPEGAIMPPSPSRLPGIDAYGAEVEAARGQAQRDQGLRDALAMRGYGNTIPTVQAQQNSMLGTPISNPFLQRQPLASGVGSASQPQAWFGSPPWLRGLF